MSTSAKMNGRGRVASINDYKIDADMAPSLRAADCLNWAADHMPGRPVSIQVLVKIAYVLPRVPKEDSKEVEVFRKNRMGQVRKHLMTDYQRDLVPVRGFGVRATTGSEDVAGTTFQTRTKRVTIAIEKLEETRQLINPAEIKNRDLKAMVQRVSDVQRLLNSAEVLKKLELPPKSEA